MEGRIWLKAIEKTDIECKDWHGGTKDGSNYPIKDSINKSGCFR